MTIRPLTKLDFTSILQLTNKFIGKHFYTTSALQQFLSTEGSSLVLVDSENTVFGIRLTIPARSIDHWAKQKYFQNKVTPELWNIDPKSVAYFKTVLIHPELRRQGWAQKLSLRSIEILKASPVNKAIVCHSWKEEPKNSSLLYLKKLGFSELYEHINFWQEIPAECIRCGSPCVCTSIEMIKYLN